MEKIKESSNTDAAVIRSSLQKYNPEIYTLIAVDTESDTEAGIQSNIDGNLIGSDGRVYSDIPRMRELIRIAKLIKKHLPLVPNEHTRLWRGNRRGEVGLNPSYTNSLEGIALPFLMRYQGPLSYIDIPNQDLKTYLTSGAENSEFILPQHLVKGVHIVGLSVEDTEQLKSESEPESSSVDDGSWARIRRSY